MLDSKNTLTAEIGRRIAARRNQLGLTQEQASVETGAKNIRAESIIKVSKALNVSTDFLLTGVVADSDCNRLANKLKHLDEAHFLAIENIIENILEFGGYNID